jgi:hypothetical protein
MKDYFFGDGQVPMVDYWKGCGVGKECWSFQFVHHLVEFDFDRL